MSLAEVVSPLKAHLESRGIHFMRSGTPDGSMTFLHPHAWRAAWRDDHVAISHGVPPRGHLTIYPIPLPRRVEASVLLDAFLEEFVEPATSRLSVVARGNVSTAPELEVAELGLELAGKTWGGVAIAQLLSGQGRVVSYWTEEEVFRRGPVEELLLVILGTLETPPDSPFAVRIASYSPVQVEEVWAPAHLPASTSAGSAEARFALQLPQGWALEEVSYDGVSGWLLLPPGVAAGFDSSLPPAPLITLSGADLLEPLEQTLDAALEQLMEADVFRVEHAARELELRGQFALVQLFVGEPPDRPGTAVRLWSLGVTDGASVVHLFAVGEASRVAALLPELAFIGASIRVLPRVPNLEIAQQLVGYWRVIEATETEQESIERCYHFHAEGQLFVHERGVDAARVIELRPDPDTLEWGSAAGSWDITGRTLTFYLGEGLRELLEVEAVEEGSAIVGKAYWERLKPRG